MARGRRRISAFLMALFLIVVLGGAAGSVLIFGERGRTGVPDVSPNSPSSGRLVEESKRFDGTAVVFEGEAVGEAMTRGEYAWLHLNDDAYYLRNVEEGAELGGYNSGMPVWVPVREAVKVTTFGDFKHEGDVVRVEGTFNAACAEHGGDIDIHATAVAVVRAGHPARDPVRPGKVAWAFGLGLVAALLYAVHRRWIPGGDGASSTGRQRR